MFILSLCALNHQVTDAAALVCSSGFFLMMSLEQVTLTGITGKRSHMTCDQ